MKYSIVCKETECFICMQNISKTEIVNYNFLLNKENIRVTSYL